MFVHIHLLGIRGATWLSTGTWDLQENVPPTKHNFIVGCQWPGLSTRPVTDESWEAVRRLFYNVFMGALSTGLYPKKLITKALTEEAVRTAFDISLHFQIEVQQELDMDSNRKLLAFAGRAAVGILHGRSTFDAHHCRNGSWLVNLSPWMSFGTQMGMQQGTYKTKRNVPSTSW